MESCIAIEKFRQDLLNCINSCGLPIGTAYYVAQHVMEEFTKSYMMALNKEQKEAAKGVE